MRKTLRFVALAGVILTCSFSSEKPSYANNYYCHLMNGSPCDAHPDDASLCFTDSIPETEGICYCRSGGWSCTF